MYVRRTTVRKNGKTHQLLALAGALALRITRREEQYEVFEAPPGQRSEPVAVRLGLRGLR